jgi:hypothetical protein
MFLHKFNLLVFLLGAEVRLNLWEVFQSQDLTELALAALPGWEDPPGE